MNRPRPLRPDRITRACALIVVLINLAFGAGCFPRGITVEWTTATEERTAGFNLYRADSPDGNYVKINAQLIPGSSDPLKGGKYQYQDSTADPARTYYYKLEEIEVSGRSNWSDPIMGGGEALTSSWSWVVGGLVLGLVVSGALVFFSRRRFA